MYVQTVGAIGYENGMLRTAKWVAGAYELSLRSDNLSFGHHQIVAALPVDERTAILAEAEPWHLNHQKTPDRTQRAVARRERRRPIES